MTIQDLTPEEKDQLTAEVLSDLMKNDSLKFIKLMLMQMGKDLHNANAGKAEFKAGFSSLNGISCEVIAKVQIIEK